MYGIEVTNKENCQAHMECVTVLELEFISDCLILTQSGRWRIGHRPTEVLVRD